MKRVLSLLLVLVMLVGLMPTTALATGTGESAENPWSGRSAVFVGDSITAGDNAAKYYRLLEQSLDLGSVTVMGVGGSCFSAYSDYGTGNQPLINRYQNIPSTDLIMVFMGTNDYGHETPLGSVEDTQDGTFYGALNTIIPALVAKHTASKIVFVTPLHRYGFGTSKILGTPFTYDSIPNGVGATLGDYVDALKTVCANNGVSVIDLHTECTLDPSDADIRAEYMPDGIHPSAAGHAVIAGIMESHLRTFEPVESEPVVLPEMIQGNKFASTSNQPCRASSRINYYLKAGTVITLNDPDVMQWACARTSNEFSSNNLGYFPDSQWTDKVTAVVAEDGWIGFTFKYRDETQSFDLTRPLSDYITIHTHSYSPAVTAPTCTEQGYTIYTCQCDDSYVDDYTEATGHSYENSICTGCGDININWEIGTIAAASGANASNTTRLRTTDYLALADFSGVSVNVGYQLTWLAYDAEKNYIGNGTSSFTGYWQPSGQSIATADIQNLYSNAVYFRLALKAVSGGSMTLEDVQNSCVTFIPFGEALPEPEYELEYESSLNIGSWQDGAIWNGKLFVLGGSGTGAVYDLEELCKLATFSLDSADVLKPHTNSVCFGSTYYAPGDEYPLLYVNIYNNYASAEDRMEGTCCAYRISKTDGGFATELVQVIEIGFTEDLTLWKSMENNGDVRPYGNFLVDTEANKLYAYVMRDATNSTRFFKFDLPELTDGIYSETYGCNVVTLESADIERQFDTEYFNYLQGGTYSSGMILSAEGFNSGSSAEPAIRIIDLQTGTISATYYMANSGLTAEPEVVCVDPTTGLLYYAPADGILRILSIPDVHFHGYTSCVISPTCTEQGYTTYTCECGDSYVDDYTEATGHSYENGICAGCGATASPYLQQLPEDIIGCTNLYDSLVPVKGYYTATKYDTSNGAVLSVVIPVEPGDRISASSFGPVSENMGSANGIRVTYLLGDKIVASLSAGEVYSAYTANGYITVPDGVDAVCVPWWVPGDSNWLTLSQISKNFAVHIPKTVSAQAPTCTESGYTAGEICEVCNASLGEREEIPPTGHTYGEDACTVCGAVNLRTILGGKYVSVLGDSISTFNGYSNDATVNTTIGGNGPRYDAGTADTKPGSFCLLESVDQTWWMHFADRSGMKLLVNNSWAGSQVFGGQTGDGRVIPAAYLDRCVNLHDNTLENNPGNAAVYPDVIFVYLGINDYNFNRSQVGTGTVDYSSLVSADGTYVTPATFGEAYGIMLHKMRNAYPDAQIFAMTLLPENLYSVDKTAWEQHNTYIRAAAEYYNIPVVDLAKNCAITWENYSGYMIDKIHPTTAGMKLISDCIEAELVTYYTENPPHTHSYTATVTAPTCTEQGYTTYTCECGESYVADLLDATEHTYKNGICTGCGEKLSFKGKTISILGDSISTYTGVSNDSSVNATLKGGAIYYNAGTQDVYRTDTWWQQTIDALSMELLVNNSWSGSAVLHTRSGTAGAYVDRCVQLHNTAGDEPDVIVVFLGTNDFSYYQSALGTANIDYAKLITDNGDGTYTYATPKTTCEAYAVMLHKMVNRYPDAEVYCMNLLPRRNPDHDGKDVVPAPTQFNGELAKVISHFGCTVVDLENCGITPAPENFDIYITDQRVHPGPLGMDKMTQALIDTMMGMEDSTFAVSQNLVNVTANVSGGIVLAGESFSVALTPATGFDKLTVTVTMGGKDITASVYSDGKVNIPAVTDNVVITASATVDDTPHNYFWEISGNNFVNVAKNDLSANALTRKAGSITDGVIKSAYFQLEKPVVLRHNLPWIVEWRVSGTSWTGMLLSGNTNSSAAGNSYLFKTTQSTGFIGFGEAVSGSYHNYGVALASQGIDLAAEHTYRVENRIAADGSNMVYLLVDGKDYGPMNHYYIGGNSDQGKQVDWLNGRDLCFFYIGSNGHPLNNCQLDYLSVTECNHTYENGTCTGCGEAQPGPVVTQQPVDGEAKLGERYCVTVEAEGEGLTYQWYLRNAGSKRFSKSSVKDSTYDDVMTESRAGREVYCVITDANGNSVTTDIVKLVCLPSEKLEIITQPTDGEAVLGERYCVTVEAKGEGLKYQWYFRNKGATRWTKSTVRDNTYDDVMNNTRNGREVYCVITDLAGNQVTTDIVKLVRVPMKLEITAQPADATAAFGEQFCVTVAAKGEGLKYQWYYRNSNSLLWHKSGVRDNTYDDEMTKARNGREVYCVITDKHGNSVTTDTVKLIAVPSVELKVLGVTYESAAMGERYCVTVEAEGDCLTYQWYFRNAGSSKWYKSSVRDNTYDDVMTKSRANREVYCVITDALGNRITTEVVTLALGK